MRTAFHHLLSTTAADSPERPALSYKDETLTYAAVWERVLRFSAQLSDLGLAPGDRVAICLEKRVETVVAMFATSVAGGIFVPVNHVLKSPQVGHILTDCGATVLVTTAERLAQLQPTLSRSAVEHVVVVGPPPQSGPDVIPVHVWLPNGTPPGPGSTAPSAPRPIDMDPAAILYTSGSTGRPKGVVLSHRNLIVGAESVSSYLGNTQDDVILSVLPLSFDAGLSQMTTAFSVGAHSVLMNYLLPRDVPKLCALHRVTGLTCVPPLWFQLVGVPWSAESTAHMRYFANTGGRMPRTTLSRLRETFPDAAPFLMYGLTEAFRSTYLDPAEVDRRPDSIGKAIPNAEILVLRPDGTRCRPGEEGELVHRGALVGLGYWNDPERTAERYRPFVHPGQEWRTPEMAVWSGDTVVADDEGFLYFVGRSDDMIKTSGYRVSPTEIEEAAYGTGLVRDAVAVGVDDPALGQRVVLVSTAVDTVLDEEKLVGELRRALPAFMVPSRIEVRDELPRSPNGKFDRNLIRAEVTA
jgi:acyl-CoA ligase (AMP-forming) (exosortase A-associated)